MGEYCVPRLTYCTVSRRGGAGVGVGMGECGDIFGLLREAVFVVVQGDVDAYRDCF